MMKSAIRGFALASLATLALAASADAQTILIFGQQNNNDVVTSASAAGTTTFSSAPIPVTVSNFAGVTPPPGTTLNESFNFTSTAAINGSAGNFSQGGFSGTFSFVVPGVGGVTQIAGTLTNGTLSTFTGASGTTGSFNSSNVTFTTLGPAVLNLLGVPAVGPLIQGSLSLSLNGFNPNSVGSLNFSARNSGLVTASVIPEPASVIMTSMAVVAGLGCFGLRRSKTSKV